MSNLEVALRYLRAMQDHRDVTEFYLPHATQRELPNRLNPNGITRTVDEIRQAAEAMKTEHYEVRGAMEHGDCVAMEIEWQGTLARPLGELPAGSVMRATFAMFLDFEDGKIVSQRNYDCFAPF